MADNKSLEKISRVHAMARRCIAEKLRQLTYVASYTNEKAADAILAELAAHDPPLLICTPDEVKEDEQ